MTRDPFALFPLSIDGWEGSTALLAPNVEETLGADDYVSAFFRAPGEAEGVDLFVSYYASQTRGEAIHSPAVCLPGAGWEVAAIRPVEVTLPGTRFGTFTLNRALIQKGLERQLVYYWFEGRGRRITNDFAAKFHTVADGLTIGRTDGGLVRVITPIGADGEAAADARLQRFLGASVDRLPTFHPGVTMRQGVTGPPAPCKDCPCPPPAPRVSILVISYNTREMTLDCLRSLEAETHGAARGDRGGQQLAGRLGRRHRRGLPRAAPDREPGQPRLRQGQQRGGPGGARATTSCCSTPTRWCSTTPSTGWSPSPTPTRAPASGAGARSTPT